jgi:hypothetical protein
MAGLPSIAAGMSASCFPLGAAPIRRCRRLFSPILPSYRKDPDKAAIDSAFVLLTTDPVELFSSRRRGRGSGGPQSHDALPSQRL